MKSPENMTAKELEQLENRIKDLKAEQKRKLSEDSRKALDHAKIFIGGMVLSHFKKDWRSVNFEKLAAYFEKYAFAYSNLTCEELELYEAKKRLKNFEILHNPWDSYGKDPETVEEMATDMFGEVVEDSNKTKPHISTYYSENNNLH